MAKVEEDDDLTHLFGILLPQQFSFAGSGCLHWSMGRGFQRYTSRCLRSYLVSEHLLWTRDVDHCANVSDREPVHECHLPHHHPLSVVC